MAAKTFDGHVCPHCGTTARYARSSACVHCAKAYGKAYGKAYYRANAEKIKAYGKAYYRDNSEAWKAYEAGRDKAGVAARKAKKYASSNTPERRAAARDYMKARALSSYPEGVRSVRGILYDVESEMQRIYKSRKNKQ